jgi:hypothetical protein
LAAAGEFYDPGDGRVNREPKDRGAPVAIYCAATGVRVWLVDPTTGELGALVIDVAYTDIATAGIPSDQHSLLGNNAGVQLWRLTSGDYQVSAVYPGESKPYIIAWDACPPTKVYHLAG